MVWYFNTIPYDTGSFLLLPKKNQILSLGKNLAVGMYHTQLLFHSFGGTLPSNAPHSACSWQMCDVTRYSTQIWGSKYCTVSISISAWYR